MYTDELIERKGKVVVLDLVSGAQVITQIKDVVDDSIVVVGKMFTPMMAPHPHKPNQIVVELLPYGAPLYSTEEETHLETKYVMMLLKPNPEMISQYNRAAYGIATAGPGALDNLKGVDFSKLGNLSK